MKTLSFILIFVTASMASANYENYDEIVNKLSSYSKGEEPKKKKFSPGFNTYSRAHLGIGLAQTFFDADAAGLDSRMQNQGGLLVNVGVDLINNRWGIEGSFANFGLGRVENSEIKLREFSLKGLYKPELNKNWGMRLGLGVSSRFMNISNSLGSEEFRTPSGLFMLGLQSHINSFISVGADMNFKTAMINDTIDKNSVDLAIRVDTHF